MQWMSYNASNTQISFADRSRKKSNFVTLTETKLKELKELNRAYKT